MPSSAKPLVTAPVPSAAPARLSVLVVDDDPQICAAYAEILSGEGYDAVTAGSRAQALADVGRSTRPFDVLVLDIGLPDADGSDLGREIHGILGPRPTLYISGWTDEFWDLSFAPSPFLVMQKPIPIPKLIGAIEYLSGRRATRPEDD
jgi:DNA-binding response OmpR family regulator